MSNYLIPLMVVVPMLCAILVNAFAKFNKSIKVLTFVVAICFPIMDCTSLEDILRCWIMQLV